MVNEASEKPLDEAALTDSFELRWPSLKSEIDAVASIPETAPAKVERPDRDLLEEILNTVRSQPKVREPRVTTDNVVIGDLRDEKAEQMFQALVRTVRTRRPLIQAWVEAAQCFRRGHNTLVLAYPEEESGGFESVNRANNRKYLEEVSKELGFQLALTKIR